MHPGTILQASQPNHSGRCPDTVPWQGLEVDHFPRPVVLVSRIEETLIDPGVVRHQPSRIPQFGSHREPLTGESEAVMLVLTLLLGPRESRE